MTRLSLSSVLPFLVLILGGCAGLDPTLLESVLGSTAADRPLDETTVTRGLHEALRIGSRRAIARIGRTDGYLANELIRIYVPEELEEMAAVLRKIGFRRQIDDLETAMNRAAEQAASEAIDVFADAIAAMSFADAFGILRGGTTAATDYLRDRTSETLNERFRPIIANKMEKVDLYRMYNRLADTYNDLPFTHRPAVDLETYLSAKALDGLFFSLAQEESKIRKDPVARTTELLRRVFASN